MWIKKWEIVNIKESNDTSYYMYTYYGYDFCINSFDLLIYACVCMCLC